VLFIAVKFLDGMYVGFDFAQCSCPPPPQRGQKKASRWQGSIAFRRDVTVFMFTRTPLSSAAPARGGANKEASTGSISALAAVRVLVLQYADQPAAREQINDESRGSRVASARVLDHCAKEA
jgi:hypothetical protein